MTSRDDGGGGAEKDASSADAASTSSASASAAPVTPSASSLYRAAAAALAARRAAREAATAPALPSEQLKRLNLDSSIKKASATVKRLREWGSGGGEEAAAAAAATATAAAPAAAPASSAPAASSAPPDQPRLSQADAAALLSAIEAVNLSKYAGELAAAVPEASPRGAREAAARRGAVISESDERRSRSGLSSSSSPAWKQWSVAEEFAAAATKA